VDSYAPPVLATRLLPRSRLVTAVLMISFALLTAAAAQIRIPLPFTPVPITGQTFAVLLSGAALGMWAGAGSQVIYLLLGGLGLPFFTEASGGWDVFLGPTAGYLIGFPLAAALVGWMAERRQDRSVLGTAIAFVAGSAVIYGCGVLGLMRLGLSLGEAISLGVLPFLVGDLLKAALAAALLPATWKLVGEP
jgi:biotin transport system substrate-specific component